MIQIVTKEKGVRKINMDETALGVGHLYSLLSEIETICAGDRLLFVICRRPNTRLTLFDMMMTRLEVSLMILSPRKGILYPANVLKRRASALCAS